MEWVCPQYSRSRVDWAGELLISDRPDLAKFDEALTIINNWRASHSRPLYTFRLGLRRHAEKVDESALVAQRIKRLSSISLKLRLAHGMKLSRMHDIGGCRAVVSSNDLVAKLVRQQVARVVASASDAEGAGPREYLWHKAPKPRAPTLWSVL
jgi:hypothetical protein